MQFPICPLFPPVPAPLHDSRIAAKLGKQFHQTNEIRSGHGKIVRHFAPQLTLMVRQTRFLRRKGNFARSLHTLDKCNPVATLEPYPAPDQKLANRIGRLSVTMDKLGGAVYSPIQFNLLG